MGIVTNGEAAYTTGLSNHLKATANGQTLRTKDNVSYLITIANNAGAAGQPPHRRYRGTVLVDINASNNVSTAGEDAFWFGLFDDGSLRPKGHTDWQGGADTSWTVNCPANAVPTNASYCAGHIFDNNMKVLYK